MAALVLPESYPYYLDLIHSLSVGPFLIGLAKFGIAFPVSYHTYNGIRHLVSLIIWFIDWENVRLFSILNLFEGTDLYAIWHLKVVQLEKILYVIFGMFASFADFLFIFFAYVLHLPKFISWWCL